MDEDILAQAGVAGAKKHKFVKVDEEMMCECCLLSAKEWVEAGRKQGCDSHGTSGHESPTRTSETTDP